MNSDNSERGGSDKLLWKIVAGAAAAGAGWLARNAIERTWSAVTGNPPPQNPESPETTWGEAIAWAVASGVLIEVARLTARRTAARSWERRYGSLPPGLETVG